MNSEHTGVTYTDDAADPASPAEERLRRMGEPLVGLPMTEAFALMQSLVISTLGNHLPPDRVELTLKLFCGQLIARRAVAVELSRIVMLRRAEAAGHA